MHPPTTSGLDVAPPVLAIIGSGPSGVFLLHRLSVRADEWKGACLKVVIFEQSGISGTGMPYSPETTDRYNLSNISSEEIPPLPASLVEWMRARDTAMRGDPGFDGAEIRSDEIYPRLLLGRYFRDQYQEILQRLRSKGVVVEERAGCEVIDIVPDPDAGYRLIHGSGGSHEVRWVVIATGHYWAERDRPDQGYYASPWPISKLIPDPGAVMDYEVGTLGASLSAFDVVSTLAHRHGRFVMKDGALAYEPAPGTGGFRAVMHAIDGALPYLQFVQAEPLRQVHRHVSREEMDSMIGEDGFLRLTTFFDRACRARFMEAFEKDGMPEMVGLLADTSKGLAEMTAKLSDLRSYGDPFEGMRLELAEAEESLRTRRVTHWKELLDDLMYALNFHAHRLSAEDHRVVREEVLPFVMTVIAAMPLKSARAMLALHAAGKLDLIPGKVEVKHGAETDGVTTVVIESGGRPVEKCYRMFVDCSGQAPLTLEDFPFRSLRQSGCVDEARLEFRLAAPHDGEWGDRLVVEGGREFLKVGGIVISDDYRMVGSDGEMMAGLWDMAFPHMTGLRPYSYGLQACDETAKRVAEGVIAAISHPRSI